MDDYVDIAQLRRSQRGEPTWEVAAYFPRQGHWAENEYLALDDRGGRFIELNNGVLEFPPMPTLSHQLLLGYLLLQWYRRLEKLDTDVKVLPGPLPLRLAPNKYREPDILLLRPEHLREDPRYPHQAELVVEIVSPGDCARRHDFDTKRIEYAQAGIPEYWIVDSENHLVHILTLNETADERVYREYGGFGRGQCATGPLISGLAIEVDILFAAGKKYS